MKRLIVLLMLTGVALPALAKSDWKGKVVDEMGEPVAYANVAVRYSFNTVQSKYRGTGAGADSKARM